MSIRPEHSPAPRDTMPELRAHRGMMMYKPESNEFVKYAVNLGEPTPQGFFPLEKQIGVMGLGIIYLKSEGSVQAGYYAITPRDLNRRRIDARPTRRLSHAEASALVGAPVPESGAASGSSADQRAVSTVAEGEDHIAADLAFQNQVLAIQHDTDPEEDFL